MSNIIHCSNCQITTEINPDDYQDMYQVYIFVHKELGWGVPAKELGFKTGFDIYLCPTCVKEKFNFWRVPTLLELISLLWENPLTNEIKYEGIDIDVLEEANYIDNEGKIAYLNAFEPESADNIFWATAKSNDATIIKHTAVSFTKGTPLRFISAKSKVHTRLVRTHQVKPSWKFGNDVLKRYEISSCGEYVTDHRTGLQWQREALPKNIFAEIKNIRD